MIHTSKRLGGLALIAILPTACTPSYHVVIDEGPPASGTELPLRLICQRPVTDVEIGGQTLAMNIDAGGHHTFRLQPHLVERLSSVEPTGGSTISSDAAGRLSLEHELRVPEIRLGDIVLRDSDVHEFGVGLPDEVDAQVSGSIGAATG
jgi:hypothetical protein